MGRYKKDSIEAKIKAELIAMFEMQERVTIQEGIEEYFEPKTPYASLIAKIKMRAIIEGIKRSFLREGIPFGCLNEFGEFGIPAIKEEYQCLGIRRYKLWKGIVRNAAVIATSGRKKGLLRYKLETDTMQVPLSRKKIGKNAKCTKSSSK